MQFWHLLLTLAAANAGIASPVGSEARSEADTATNADPVMAKYNLKNDDTTLPAEQEFSIQAVKCYSDDWRWDSEKDYALDRAGRWCSGNGGSGEYQPGQIKRGCYNLNNLKRVNFSIQNLQDKRISLSSGACYRFLRGIINECDRGGHNGNGAWTWVADSNIGTC